MGVGVGVGVGVGWWGGVSGGVSGGEEREPRVCAHTTTIISSSSIIDHTRNPHPHTPRPPHTHTCAFMMRSMLALQPYSPVTSTHGESTMRSLTTTFSTRSPSTSFMSLHSGSNAAMRSSLAFFSSSLSSNLSPSLVHDTSFLPSYSLSCCTAYSSIGSTMNSTS